MLAYLTAAKTVWDIVDKLRATLTPTGTSRKEVRSVEHDDKALPHHLKYLNNWSAELTVGSGARQFQLDNIFIRLQLVAGQVLARQQPKAGTAVGPLTLLDPGRHSVILGEPGAGKTTLFRYLSRQLLTAEPQSSTDTFAYPLLVECRTLKDTESLQERLCALMGLRISVSGDGKAGRLRRQEQHLREQVLCEVLNSLPVLILIDGLDETSTDKRLQLIREMSALLPAIDESTIIVTCRFGALVASIQGAKVYAVQPFDNEQRKDFCRRWFAATRKNGARFLKELKKTNYADMASTPLHLANLCLVFEARDRLPESRIRIYEAILSLRLERWDRERGIKRHSELRQGLRTRGEAALLASMSFDMARRGVGPRFATQDLTAAYANVASRFQLPANEADRVAAEIESHTGLLVQIGDWEYEFYHLSLFEYLCADHLSRSQLDTYAMRDLLAMPEPAAIACGLSAEPDRFLMHLAYQVRLLEASDARKAARYRDFWSRFLSRLDAERIVLPKSPQTGFAAVLVAGFCWEELPGNTTRVALRAEVEGLLKVIRQWFDKWGLRWSIKQAIDLFEYRDVRREYVLLGPRGGWPDYIALKPKWVAIDRWLFDWANGGERSSGGTAVRLSLTSEEGGK